MDRKSFRISESRRLFGIEDRVKLRSLQRTENRVGARVIIQQALHPLEVMPTAIFAFVDETDVHAQTFQIPFRQCVGGGVQHILVERKMPFHAMRAKTVGQHDVVHIVIRPFDAVVQRLQPTGRVLI